MFKPTCLALALALSTTAAPAAEYKWGAISLDTSDLGPDGGYGIGGGDTEDEAKENAQKFCAEDGAKGCKVVTTYEECGSVAVKMSGKGRQLGHRQDQDGRSLPRSGEMRRRRRLQGRGHRLQLSRARSGTKTRSSGANALERIVPRALLGRAVPPAVTGRPDACLCGRVCDKNTALSRRQAIKCSSRLEGGG